MFRGRFEHNMTDKGRISVPSRFRDVLRNKYADEALIVTNFDKCLTAYPVREWNKLEERIADFPQFKPEVISFLRYLMGGAVDCPLDGQGRILIPPILRKQAGLNKEVVIIGMLTRFEIWSKDTWDSGESAKTFEEFKKSSVTLVGEGL